MSRYLRTAPEYRELGALGQDMTTEQKKQWTAVTLLWWGALGFVGYKLIKAVSK